MSPLDRATTIGIAAVGGIIISGVFSALFMLRAELVPDLSFEPKADPFRMTVKPGLCEEETVALRRLPFEARDPVTGDLVLYMEVTLSESVRNVMSDVRVSCIRQ